VRFFAFAAYIFELKKPDKNSFAYLQLLEGIPRLVYRSEQYAGLMV
jgi:hypothetical protein